MQSLKTINMKRKDYFRQFAVVIVMCLVFIVASTFGMDDASTAWRIIVPSFFSSILVGVVAYGLIKYK